MSQFFAGNQQSWGRVYAALDRALDEHLRINVLDCRAAEKWERDEAVGPVCQLDSRSFTTTGPAVFSRVVTLRHNQMWDQRCCRFIRDGWPA